MDHTARRPSARVRQPRKHLGLRNRLPRRGFGLRQRLLPPPRRGRRRRLPGLPRYGLDSRSFRSHGEGQRRPGLGFRLRGDRRRRKHRGSLPPRSRRAGEADSVCGHRLQQVVPPSGGAGHRLRLQRECVHARTRRRVELPRRGQDPVGGWRFPGAPRRSGGSVHQPRADFLPRSLPDLPAHLVGDHRDDRRRDPGPPQTPGRWRRPDPISSPSRRSS